LAPENLLKTSGRGIFLMRAFMDEVLVNNLSPGTEIIMTKHVRGNSADAKESVQ
jgi:serine/threonine-protein kinase RsbW